jgi:rhodanese-related sulfurtransferase/rubrerythrin
MKITDVFSKVDTVSTEKAKKIIQDMKDPGVELIDVREPEEYEDGHLPGAKLVPLSHILESMKELDSSKTVLAYCRSGNRSRSAAALMRTHGFDDIYSIEGGISAWNGLVASGSYEAGIFLLEGKETFEDFIALAWKLEDATRRFYQQARACVSEGDARQVFTALVNAEQKHKQKLIDAYKEVKTSDIAEGVLVDDNEEGYMESGISLEEAVAWLRQKDRNLPEILEYSMQLETNSLDLYTRMMSRIENENAKKVFSILIQDEKLHLERLGRLLGNKFKG